MSLQHVSTLCELLIIEETWKSKNWSAGTEIPAKLELMNKTQQARNTKNWRYKVFTWQLHDFTAASEHRKPHKCESGVTRQWPGFKRCLKHRASPAGGLQGVKGEQTEKDHLTSACAGRVQVQDGPDGFPESNRSDCVRRVFSQKYFFISPSLPPSLSDSLFVATVCQKSVPALWTAFKHTHKTHTHKRTSPLWL